MLNSLATGFERKILFGAGRHLWNIVGVAGVVAIATGGIFALTSPPPEKILSQEDWIKQSSNSKSDVIRKDLSWLSYAEKDCTTSTPGMGSCEKEKIVRRDFIRKHGVDPADYKNPEEVYKSNMEKRQRRIFAPLLLGWGAGTVAAVSVISAILAVERNTRPNQ